MARPDPDLYTYIWRIRVTSIYEEGLKVVVDDDVWSTRFGLVALS